jgi:Ca-activated chloride channel family protein
MTFLWPQLLWLLLVVPVLVAVYVRLMQRRKKFALRYASLSMVKEAMGAGQRLRRHIPPLLFLLGLTALMVAIARPAAVLTLPSQNRTIILAMDVSGSMRAMDVEPNRLAAAQAAARNFVSQQPSGTRIGVVAFAATAFVVQPPTETRDDVLAAIDRFQLQRGTAIGSGLMVALKAIFPDVELELPLGAAASAIPAARPLDLAGDAPKAPPEPVAPGSYNSAAIILLTDGQTTTGPDPLDAAKAAADRGVRVYTVGVGTVDGQVLGFEGWSMRVRLDEDTLKSIATTTRGEYFYAGTATDLKKIYQALNTRLVLEKRETEITALFGAAGAAFMLLGALLSLLWFNRIL